MLAPVLYVRADPNQLTARSVYDGNEFKCGTHVSIGADDVILAIGERAVPGAAQVLEPFSRLGLAVENRTLASKVLLYALLEAMRRPALVPPLTVVLHLRATPSAALAESYRAALREARVRKMVIYVGAGLDDDQVLRIAADA